MAKRTKTIPFLEAAALAEHDECILWPFATQSQGYGQLEAFGKIWLAHRAACIMAHGEPPTPAHEAAHACKKTRLCVNGNHLRWATRKENAEDQLAHGTHQRGERCVTGKLTEEDVHAIRRALRAGATQRPLAAKFGISPRQIRSIRDGRDWAWLVTP